MPAVVVVALILQLVEVVVVVAHCFVQVFLVLLLQRVAQSGSKDTQLLRSVLESMRV